MQTLAKRALLLSTSTLYGGGYLDYAEAEIRNFLGSLRGILFVPYALHDRDAYAATARHRFEAMGYALDSIHTTDPKQAIQRAEAIFVGGSNTFRLLKCLYGFDLLGTIRERVQNGMPYLGSSAGSNVACPTIKTTNDMPIVQPPSLNALGLVPFQINPHYLDPDANSRHMGESREERLRQYLEENETPVIGMREGAMLLVSDGVVTLRGTNGARLFRRNREPEELNTGSTLGL